MNERTLKERLKFSGIGVHTGMSSTILLHPEEEGGIRFLKDGTVIPATIDSVVETERGVVLSRDEKRIATVEHLLSALYGCKIDHLTIEVMGEEIPAMDGSAYPFVKAMEEIGFSSLDRKKGETKIQKTYTIEEKGCFAYARPSEELEIHYIISYDHPLLSYQEYRYNGRSDFTGELAPARTYGLLSWKEKLMAMGYALSASTDNTLIYDKEGIINKPRFPDEAVRHKVSDFLGDIYLLQPSPVGYYILVRGGHRLHIELLKKIKRSEY